MPLRIPAAVALGAPGAAVVAALGLAGWRLASSPAPAPPPPRPPAESSLPAPVVAEVLVDVSGAVQHPGLYRLPATARVVQAIAAAGGVTPDADPGHMPDLAALVHDGHQVNVPFLSGSRGGLSLSGRVPFSQRLDVNVATVDELAAVPGMPIGLPEAIVDARTTFGPFPSLAQMRQMLGLESSVFTAVRPWLRAGRSIR